MVRLTYIKLKNGDLKSKEVTSKKGVTFFVRISYLEGSWKIFHAKRRNCVKQGFSKNKNVLRRVVRRELQKLGVKLEKEFKKSGYAKTKSGKLL